MAIGAGKIPTCYYQPGEKITELLLLKLIENIEFALFFITNESTAKSGISGYDGKLINN